MKYDYCHTGHAFTMECMGMKQSIPGVNETKKRLRSTNLDGRTRNQA